MNVITSSYLGPRSNSSSFRNTLTRGLCISVSFFNYESQYKRHFLRTSSAQLATVRSSILMLFSKINIAAEKACEGLVVLYNDNLFYDNSHLLRKVNKYTAIASDNKIVKCTYF